MLTISKKAEYAVAALVELAEASKGYVSSQSVAERQMIPPNLISQLLSTMTKAGWVTSARGPKGGVKLKRDPALISLHDVVELFDGPVGITRCLRETGSCRREEVCRAKDHWKDAQDGMVESLRRTTISTLSQPGPGPDRS